MRTGGLGPGTGEDDRRWKMKDGRWKNCTPAHLPTCTLNFPSQTNNYSPSNKCMILFLTADAVLR